MAENSISYSQFSIYLQCPRKWELEYVQNLRQFEQSIHTIFGTAMHETLQNYLHVTYNQSAKKADELSLSSDLQSRLVTLYGEAANETRVFVFVNAIGMLLVFLTPCSFFVFFIISPVSK